MKRVILKDFVKQDAHEHLAVISDVYRVSTVCKSQELQQCFDEWGPEPEFEISEEDFMLLVLKHTNLGDHITVL